MNDIYEKIIPLNTAEYIDRFNRTDYSTAFGRYSTQAGDALAEALEADAAEMANGIVRYIDSRISGLWKKRKLLDMRYFLVLYVIPALLELNSDGSHRLVLALHDCWLKTHSGQDFEPMRFSEIASGFNDTVLGFKIPSGGKQ